MDWCCFCHLIKNSLVALIANESLTHAFSYCKNDYMSNLSCGKCHFTGTSIMDWWKGFAVFAFD